MLKDKENQMTCR